MKTKTPYVFPMGLIFSLIFGRVFPPLGRLMLFFLPDNRSDVCAVPVNVGLSPGVCRENEAAGLI
jgi:hypothetical protein